MGDRRWETKGAGDRGKRSIGDTKINLHWQLAMALETISIFIHARVPSLHVLVDGFIHALTLSPVPQAVEYEIHHHGVIAAHRAACGVGFRESGDTGKQRAPTLTTLTPTELASSVHAFNIYLPLRTARRELTVLA